MDERSRTRARLEHIREACLAVHSFVGGLSYENFVGNELVLSATIRQLEVIGEAARNLDASFKSRHPEVPWRKLIGMRNVLIHEYFDVFFDKVWEVAINDAPELERSITRILQDELNS